jgi:hypothetical protein
VSGVSRRKRQLYNEAFSLPSSVSAAWWNACSGAVLDISLRKIARPCVPRRGESDPKPIQMIDSACIVQLGFRLREYRDMKSYNDIKFILENDLRKAAAAHECEVLDPVRTSEALAKSIERYDRFVLHGMIPEDFIEDDRAA